MRCNNCGRVIKENESFYMVDFSAFCEDCVDERICFCVGGGVYEEQDIEEYSSKELAIRELKQKINKCSEEIENLKKYSDFDSILKIREKQRKRFVDKLAFIKGE